MPAGILNSQTSLSPLKFQSFISSLVYQLCFSDKEEETNVHRELLKKPERQQVTWNTHYLKPERDDEKSLVTKANDITDRVLKHF